MMTTVLLLEYVLLCALLCCTVKLCTVCIRVCMCVCVHLPALMPACIMMRALVLQCFKVTYFDFLIGQEIEENY